MEIDYRAIGKRVKNARINAHITQEELSETINMSLSHISNIETGNTKLSLPTLITIADALSVTADDLLCDNNSQSVTVYQNELQKLVADCSYHEMRIITDIVQAAVISLRQNDNNLKKQNSAYNNHQSIPTGYIIADSFFQNGAL